MQNDFRQTAELAAGYFKTNIEALSTPLKTRESYEARAIISEYLVEVNKVSKVDIAEMFNRHQSVISRACTAANELPSYCHKFREKKEGFWKYMLIHHPESKIREKTLFEGGKSHLPGGKITVLEMGEPFILHP